MGQERIIHAALLGAGTVGSGVYKLVKDLEEEIISKTGARLVVDKILVRDTTKAREGIPSELLIDRWDEILNDPQIEIVIEVMGGIRPALTWLEEALRAGKQVVTANKDLLAEYGEQLFDAAEAGKCDLHFEAAVAGAIPIIRPLRQSLVASELTEVMGIVNGTTNYILTRMTEDGMGYEEALALATKLGYAESDPTADVEGYDAGRKVAIMASIAFNSNVTFSQVYTEGITATDSERRDGRCNRRDAKHSAPFLRQDRLWLLPESSGEIRRGYGQSVFPTDSGNGQARRARQHCRDFGQ